MTTFGQTLAILPYTTDLEVQLTTRKSEQIKLKMKVSAWLTFLEDNRWIDYKSISLYAEGNKDMVLELVEFNGCTKCGSNNCHGDLC